SAAGTGHRFGIEAPPVLLLAAAESGDRPPSLARGPPGPIPFSSAIFFEAAKSNVPAAGSPQPVMNQSSVDAASLARRARFRNNSAFIASDPSERGKSEKRAGR